MTKTYSIANTVLDQKTGKVAVEDLSLPDADPQGVPDPFVHRAETFLTSGKIRVFSSLHDASLWLWEQGAVFGDATILGETLSDAERKPPK